MTDNFSARARNLSDQSLLPSPIHPSDFGEGGDRSRHASIMSHPGSGLLSSSSSFAGAYNYKHSSISEKFSLAPSPAQWGTPLLLNDHEPDDELHNPDPVIDKKLDQKFSFSPRGFVNLGFLGVLVVGLLLLFAGYPIITHVLDVKQTTQGGFNLGGINASGQIPEISGNYGLIDQDTPKEAYTTTAPTSGEEMVLVFSDEFEQEGRSFYSGDDPYWEAVDLHYWGTNDLEWYDPGQVTTGNGSLLLTIEKVSDPSINHDMDYKSGMIQSWNKFCFTGGLIEVSVRLPGSNSVPGLWPAVWTMGNLGRAAYGATLEGLWPYSYDSCDVGTLPNQTYPGTQTPLAAVTNGDPYNNDVLSFLPGQRLSACTCSGESHPGPMRKNGSYVGRAAPEIDIFEATVSDDEGHVSLSGQWAPFNAQYSIYNTSGEVKFHTDDVKYNDYVGGVWQQTTSGLAKTNQTAYELHGGQFAVYGFEYQPGFDNAYITWINNGKASWTIYQTALKTDPRVEIAGRPIAQEPMYIIANLGFSTNFVSNIDFSTLTFPATMAIDYVRIYQPKNAINLGCDPEDFPTADYIETYKEAYSNNNLTTWKQYGESWPKNRLSDNCT